MVRTGWSVAAECWDPVLRALVGAPRCPQRQALLLEMSEDVCRSCANPTCARAWARVMLVCVCCVCMHVPVCACACARACESCRQLSACVCGCVCARAWKCVHGMGTCAHVSACACSCTRGRVCACVSMWRWLDSGTSTGLRGVGHLSLPPALWWTASGHGGRGATRALGRAGRGDMRTPV